MGVIWDIIKDIPTAAVLKERVLDFEAKLSESETKIALLERDLSKASAQLQKLRADNERLTQQINIVANEEEPLHEIAVKILRVFGLHTDSINESYIHQITGLAPTEFGYYFNDLVERGYIRLGYSMIDEEGSYYDIEQKGRKYLITHPVDSN